jgi:hypothetical protein
MSAVFKNANTTGRLIIGYIAIISSITAVIVAFGSLSRSESAEDEARRQAEIVRMGQIQNCHRIGDPIEEFLLALGAGMVNLAHNQSGFARAEIQQTQGFGPETFAELLPSLSATEIDRLYRGEIARSRQVVEGNTTVVSAVRQAIRTLREVPPCNERYPPLGG